MAVVQNFRTVIDFLYNIQHEIVPSVATSFIQTWIRKLVHARFNESLMGYKQVINVPAVAKLLSCQNYLVNKICKCKYVN